MNLNFVHLGAGAGDLDEGANFRCGFTEFIKRKYNKNSNVFLVEANPKNIEKLKVSYKNFENINIFNFAISTKDIDELKFFYSEKDAPHYQVCSTDIYHVKKHYPNSIIKNFSIQSRSINSFFKEFFLSEIDYLSIDIEGLDYEVLMSIDFSKYNIKNISIEYLHLTMQQKKNLINFLEKRGYSYFGYGYDHNNFDYLFKKRKNFWNSFLAKFIPYISPKHYKILNYLILK